ncbi:hypothetical protein NM688_g483 [Phlebia brevispora]|uniref:Uncharacterized protein n=1 Tax=Phlebia brevispora TaxID=194682 RepID=A0ACC1TF02_9APHY|nr:hypothetical protein NM688_g483 [Phlebia brevispora]
MSESLYKACAEVLSLSQSRKHDLETLLDPETGFAPSLRRICQDQLEEAAETGDLDISQEELDALRMESDTWGLLQAVMPLRKTAAPTFPRAAALLAENPYTPPSTLAQAVMNASRLLSELIVIREWLHDTAPTPPQLDATTGYWKFTKHQTMQALRLNKSSYLREMDPDAINRGDEGALAVDDATYEKALAQTLYAHIRAGRLQEAVELCRKARQPWRAASIRGSLLFQWRAMCELQRFLVVVAFGLTSQTREATEPRDEDAMDEAEDFDTWKGNQRRKLWKMTCTRAALNTNLPPAERALYAALAPSPQTSVQLKGACRTWSDHLWAQVSVVCEEKESAELMRLRRSFWESGGEIEGHTEDVGTEGEEGEEEEWEAEVVSSLESLATVAVEDGPPADNPYYVSQLNIILDRTDALIESFADGLRNETYDRTSPDYPAMTRFFAHLCLYLQMIDVSAPPLATQTVLEAYLQVLEAAGQRELIAMYAGALGDNAVERYAMFLTSLELSADITERRLALTRAREHGLDMERVAIVTAERTMEKAFTILPSPKGPLPSVIGIQPPPTDAEWLLVRSIEWTTFMESTYGTALEQANVILRYLLSSGRVQVAKTLLSLLPPELGSIRGPEEQALEYLHYRQFFMVWEALDRVVECQALEVPQMTMDTRVAWLSDYKTLVHQAGEQIIKLLTTEWLITDSERNGIDRRTRELVRIRQIFIPELIIRLHAMLYTSRTKIPENLKETLALANIVADARYRLYDDFGDQRGRRLSDYVSAVRHAVLVSCYSILFFSHLSLISFIHPRAARVVSAVMDLNVLLALAAIGLALLWHRDNKRKFKGVPSIGYENYFLSWLTGFRLLTHANEMMQEGYDKYKGRSFKIPELDRWRLMITGRAQIEELRRAPDEVFSFDEATNESLQTEYTLGRAIAHNPYHVPVVRAQLTRNIGNLFPHIRDELSAAFSDAIPTTGDDWVKVPALNTIMQVVCRTSNRVFVGLPLCRDPGYRALNIQFTLDVVLSGIAINLFPSFLKPLAGRILSKVPASLERGMKYLEPVILDRYAMMEQYGDDWPDRPNDMLQWLMDTAEGEEKEVHALAMRILTINFAAIHTSSMSFTHALYSLATNPEYLLPMREEVDHIVAEEGWTKAAMQKMRKVDSFLKECQRIYGLGSISMSRMALQDYTFSDGTFVPKGSMVSVAARPVHMDDEFYENAEVFDPWRFANMRDEDGEGTKHQLVNTGPEFIPFGHGRHACPGRFFAANELKCMMAHVVTTYDIKLEKEGQMPQPEWFTYAVSPNRTAEVMFRKRRL